MKILSFSQKKEKTVNILVITMHVYFSVLMKTMHVYSSVLMKKKIKVTQSLGYNGLALKGYIHQISGEY